MTNLPRDFSSALYDLKPLEGGFSPVVRLADDASRGMPLCDLSRDHLDRLLADAMIDEPGGDLKMAAAFLIGIVSMALCEVFAGLVMRGQWLAAARPAAVGLVQRFGHWEEDGDKGVCLAFDVEIDRKHAAFVDFPAPSGLAASLQDLHAPLVEALYGRCGLSQAALWRVVADSLAYSFLEHGRAQNRTDAALSHARDILRNSGSRLFNRQTDFEWVALPEAPEIGDWMRVRGGCCRYYTSASEGADYCTTCVLRAPESRRERYQDYLRRKTASA